MAGGAAFLREPWLSACRRRIFPGIWGSEFVVALRESSAEGGNTMGLRRLDSGKCQHHGDDGLRSSRFCIRHVPFAPSSAVMASSGCLVQLSSSQELKVTRN